ncbi:MAG: hypothetical protein H6839_12895 [Planctomycetes bacterium]|nr:hypothetical protein [Planctomycetota bacterium]
MNNYKIANLTFETSKPELYKLESALKRVHGIMSVTLNIGRGTFSFKHSGMEPNLNVLKEACTCAGFQLSRKA